MVAWTAPCAQFVQDEAAVAAYVPAAQATHAELDAATA
jgi:hypothetical protein